MARLYQSRAAPYTSSNTRQTARALRPAPQCNADFAVYQLMDDYLGVARQFGTLWPGSYREAPAVFRAGSGRARRRSR